MYPVLIVEDEKPIADLIDLTLRRMQYQCVKVYSGEDAAGLIVNRRFDLILLDVMLPGIDGFALMDYIAPTGTPVIFLTARDSVADRVRGLRMGACDYIVKPFAPEELLARVDVVLRRYHKDQAVFEAGGLVIDTCSMQVKKDGKEIKLTKKEYDLLLLFVQNPGRALYRDTIYEHVWGGEYQFGSKTVDLHVQRLRRKTGWDGILKAVNKVGYRLEV